MGARKKRIMKKALILFILMFVFLAGYISLSGLKNKKPKMDKKKISKVTDELTTGVELTLITVYDNYQFNPNLKTGWGFSCLVKFQDKNILFDTGADGATLLYNMDKLGIDVADVDVIVLSHIHEDHTGGLVEILKRNFKGKVIIPVSFPESFKEKIEAYKVELVKVERWKGISEGIYSSGELGDGIKEQSLVVKTTKGLVIITGCAHPGVVNIVKRIKEELKEKVYLVIGGFHLSGASDYELLNIIGDFKELGVEKAAPCHCSGDKCRELFENEYKENYIENGVGKVISL